MKKKFLLSALAVLATLGVSASFAGCDLVDGILGGGNNGDKDKDNTTNVGGNEEGDNVIVKPDDGQNVKSEQLTATQWSAAFNSSNFENYKVAYETTMTSSGSSETMRYGAVVAKPYAHYAMEVNTTSKHSMEAYYDGTASVAYSKTDDDKWQKVTGAEIEEVTDTEFLEMFTSYTYSQFTYDSSLQGYVLDKDLTGGGTLIYKFSGGKLVNVTAETSMTEGGSTYTSTMVASFTYGGQKVTIPQSVVTEANGSGSGSGSGSGTTTPDTPKGYEVNEKQFYAALDFENIDNIRMINNGESSSQGMYVTQHCESVKAGGVEHTQLEMFMSGQVSDSYNTELYVNYNVSPAIYYTSYSNLNGGKWTSSTNSSFGGMTINQFFASMPEELQKYESYKYERSEQGYVAHTEMSVGGIKIAYDVVARFTDGKLVAMDVEVNGDTRGYSNVTFEYGNYKVSIPDEVIKEAGGGSGSGSGTTKPDDDNKPTNPDNPDRPVDNNYEYSDSLVIWDALPYESVDYKGWERAFDRSNFNVYKAVLTVTENGNQAMKMVVTRGVNNCLHGVNLMGGEEIYIDFNGSVVAYVESENGVWSMENGVYDRSYEPVYEMLAEITSDNYFNYEYNRSTGNYYFRDVESGSNAEYYVKISDGKVVGAKVVMGSQQFEMRLNYSNSLYQLEIPADVIEASKNNVGGGGNGDPAPADPYERFTGTWQVYNVRDSYDKLVGQTGEIMFDFKPNGELYIHFINDGYGASYGGYYYPDNMYGVVKDNNGYEYRFDFIDFYEQKEIAIRDVYGLLNDAGYTYIAYCDNYAEPSDPSDPSEPSNPYLQFEGEWNLKDAYTQNGGGLTIEDDVLLVLKEDGYAFMHNRTISEIAEGRFEPNVGGYIYLTDNTGESAQFMIASASDYELKLVCEGITFIFVR